MKAEYLLCDDTGQLAHPNGFCSTHKGDACLQVYVPASKPFPALAEALHAAEKLKLEIERLKEVIELQKGFYEDKLERAAACREHSALAQEIQPGDAK